MGASIYYRQVKPVDRKQLSVCAPSSFMETMDKAFDTFPSILTENDILKLEGMAAMNCDGGGNPYADLIKAIKKYGVIEVYALY